MKEPVFLVPIRLAATAFAVAAGLCVVVLSLLIVFDIVARSAFRFSLQGTDELGGYALALVGSLGLTYTLLKRGHPRIDVVLRLLPAPVRRTLHVVAYALLTMFAAFMLRHALNEFSETISYGTVTNTPLQTPLWVPQLGWIVGLVLFSVATACCTLHGAWLLWREPTRVEEFYGTLTVDEEVQDYVAGDHPPTILR
jgi:TRAP-type C4-dicarboxylate transport system permease small subunit